MLTHHDVSSLHRHGKSGASRHFRPGYLTKHEVKLEDGANALAVTAKAVNKAATFMMLLSSWIRFSAIVLLLVGGRIRNDATIRSSV